MSSSAIQPHHPQINPALLNDVDQLIRQLYISTKGVSKEEIDAGVEYVQQFLVHPGRWNVIFQLFGHPDEQLFWHGCNLCLRSILISFEALEDETGYLTLQDQTQLVSQLYQYVRSDPIFRRNKRLEVEGRLKLAESIATLVMKCPPVLEQLLPYLVENAKQSIGAGFGSVDAYLLLTIINCMIEEMDEEIGDDQDQDEDDLPREIRQTRRTLQKLAPQFREIFAVYLRDLIRARSAQPQFDADIFRATSCLFIILKNAWLCGDMVALSECGIYEPMCHLYQLMLIPAQDDPAKNVIPALGSETFQLLFPPPGIEAIERTPARNRACETLLTMILTVMHGTYPQLVKAAETPAVPDEDSEQVGLIVIHFVKLVEKLFMEEINYFELQYKQSLTSSTPTSDEAATRYQSFFQCFLMFLHHSYEREIIDSGLRVCLAMISQLPAPLLTHVLPSSSMDLEIMRHLFRLLAYPPEFITWLPEPKMGELQTPAGTLSHEFQNEFLHDFEVWEKERKELVDEESLMDNVLSMASSGEISLLTIMRICEECICQQQSSWQQVEVALVLLNRAAMDVREYFGKGPVDGRVTAEELNQVRASLLRIMEAVWAFVPNYNFGETENIAQLLATQPANRAHPLLLGPASMFLARYTFMLKFVEHPLPILERTVSFLLMAIPSTQTTGNTKETKYFHGSQSITPQDGANLAGIGWTLICSEEARLLLIQSPKIVTGVLKLLFQTPNFSEHITSQMKRCWIQGLSHVMTALAYGSVASAAEVLSGANANGMQEAKGLLQTICGPFIQPIQHVFTGLQQMVQAKQQLTKVQKSQIVTTFGQNTFQLFGILSALTKPNMAEQSIMEGIDQAILQVMTQQPNMVAQLPTSLTFELFQTLNALLQQIIKHCLRKDGERDILTQVIHIYRSFVKLLYPNELAPVLQGILESSMRVYQLHPISAPLTLFERSIQRCHFGSRRELRTVWSALITQVFNLTISHRRVEMAKSKEDHDLDDRFFILSAALYEEATYPFLTSNALNQLLQYCHTTFLTPANAYFTDQCTMFIQIVLENMSPYKHYGVIQVDANTQIDERKVLTSAFFSAWKSHGYDILAGLNAILITKKNRLSKDDTHLKALGAILRANGHRYPKLNERWLEELMENGQMDKRIQKILIRLEEKEVAERMSRELEAGDTEDPIEKFEALIRQAQQTQNGMEAQTNQPTPADVEADMTE